MHRPPASWNSFGGLVSDYGQDSGTVGTSSLVNLGGTQVFTIGSSAAAVAALISSIETGSWNNPNVWNVGRLPGPYDTVVVSSPYTVALDTASTISRFVVNSGGSYNDSTFTLTVNGNVTLNGTWTGSGKLSMIASGDTLYGTGAATGKSTLEIAGASEIIASSSSVTLKIISILSGDTLNNYGSLTADTLTGSAATSVFNNLPGSTLNISGPLLAAGALNAGTCPNTVAYDGSGAQAIKSAMYCNVNVSGGGAKDVNNGSMVVINGTMDLTPGPVLTLASGASVITAGTARIKLDTNASYVNLSSSAPTLQVLTKIIGHDGWRMIAAPDSVTVGSMLASPFVTQGFTGSTYPALQPNFLWWDETSQGTSLQAWRQPSASSDTIKLGRGYMYYVFNGAQITDAPGNYSDTLPLTMSALGAEHPLTTPFDFGVSATMRSPSGPPDTTYVDTNVADYGWNLVGNPTPSTINWDAPSGWTKTNMDQTIYIWDPADSSGGYKFWNGIAGNQDSGRIAPFQAFWVKADTANPQLTCTNEVKSAGGVFLGNILAKGPMVGSGSAKMVQNAAAGSSARNEASDSISSPPVLSFGLSADGLQSAAYIMFSDAGKLSYDPYDAFSLVPPANNYLIFYSVAGEGQPALQIQDLPNTGINEPLTLPLYVGGTVAGKPLNGSFTLRWKLDGKLPAGWNIMLMDDAAGKADTMAGSGEMTFQYNTPEDLVPSSGTVMDKSSTTTLNRKSSLAMPWPVVHSVPDSKLSKTASAPRFRLVISTHNDLTGYLPSTPDLEQNYPNPFNPTTNIPFSVPASSRVTIEVFNVLGQKITTLTDENYTAGKYLVTWNPVRVASGVYFCRLIAGSHKKTIKMLLLR